MVSRFTGSMVPKAWVPRKTCSKVLPHLLKCIRNSSINRESASASHICLRRSKPSGHSFNSLGAGWQPCRSPYALSDFIMVSNENHMEGESFVLDVVHIACLVCTRQLRSRQWQPIGQAQTVPYLPARGSKHCEVMKLRCRSSDSCSSELAAHPQLAEFSKVRGNAGGVAAGAWQNFTRRGAVPTGRQS